MDIIIKGLMLTSVGSLAFILAPLSHYFMKALLFFCDLFLLWPGRTLNLVLSVGLVEAAEAAGAS